MLRQRTTPFDDPCPVWSERLPGDPLRTVLHLASPARRDQPARRGPQTQLHALQMVQPDYRSGRRSTVVRFGLRVCLPVMVDGYS